MGDILSLMKLWIAYGFHGNYIVQSSSRTRYIYVPYDILHSQVDSYLSASIAYTIIYGPTVLYPVDVDSSVFLSFWYKHSCLQLSIVFLPVHSFSLSFFLLFTLNTNRLANSRLCGNINVYIGFFFYWWYKLIIWKVYHNILVQCYNWP